MKKLVLIIFALFGLTVLNSCVYEKISHISDNNLIWVLSRKDGESHIFESDNENYSGIIYHGQYIHNETKVFTTDILHYFNVSPVYEAYALYDFTVIQNDNTIEGHLMVKPDINSNKPLLNIMLGGLVYEGDFSNLRDTVIDNKTYENCLTVDYISGKRYPGFYIKKDTIVSYTISKRDGLICYQLKNGETYYLKADQ